MSATIPENMLLSDLLKSTGYDCPDSLKAKTFDESTSGGSEVVLEDNKEATIDVLTYTAPVEITPTAGKDGMKKATVTLENIPSGGDITSGFAIELENGDSDGTIFSKVIAFGTAQLVSGAIPKGTYNAFFVTDDIVEGETHDFTDIPHLFQVPTNVSATRSQWNPTRYTVTISEDEQLVNSGEYGTQGRRALLVLYPSN